MKTIRMLSAGLLVLALTGGLLADDSVIDTSFGDFGFAELTVGLTGNDPRDMALQPDGKIVMTGLARDNQSAGSYGFDVALVRFTAGGLPDTSFSGDGKLMTDINSSGNTYTDDWGNAVVVQADGKIVVAGTSRQYTRSGSTTRFEWFQWDLMLLRYNPDGSLDSSFGDGGKVIHDINGAGDQPEGFSDVALQSDGRIVAVGYAYPGSNRFLVARFLPDGSLDPSFGAVGDGLVVEHFPLNSLESARDVKVLPDDSLLVTGDGTKPDGNRSISILKLTPDGLPDTSFNGSGKLAQRIGHSSSARTGAVDANGRILAAGWTQAFGGADEEIFVLRLNADGTPDATFGSNGLVISALGDYRYHSMESLLVGTDGRITVTGTPGIPDGIGILRLNADGSLDTSFGIEGGVVYDIGGPSGLYVWNAAFDEQGRLIIGARIQYWVGENYVDYFTAIRLGGGDGSVSWDNGYTEPAPGWRHLDWFGYYYPTAEDWIWHLNHGFAIVHPDSIPGDCLLYTVKHGWVWTSSEICPWYWNFATEKWVYLY